MATLATAVVIAAGGLLAAAGPAAAEEDPCGYWRAGNWLTGYSYWYRHCVSNSVRVHIQYDNNTSEVSCFGPWEKRQLSWRTTNAYYTGHTC